MSKIDIKVNTTIYAVASRGAVAMIRVSGMLADLQKLALAFSTTLPKPRVATRSTLKLSNKTLDDVILTYFAAPKSFTGEDTLEICCHGSEYIISKICETCEYSGILLAQPGEFSYRSFINEKMTLSQAENVLELINSTNEIEHSLAINAIQNDEITRDYQDIYSGIVKLLSYCEVGIDFAEDVEESDAVVSGWFRSDISQIIRQVGFYVESTATFNKAREGLQVVIYGEPNVGKSTLINAICRKDVSIVTNIAGTTRDVVKSTISVDGVPVTLSDTAGIRSNSPDEIEQIGISRAQESLKTADLVIILGHESNYSLNHHNVYYVNNKSDLESGAKDGIWISAKNNDIQPVLDIIKAEVQKYKDCYMNSKKLTARQYVCAKKMLSSLSVVNEILNSHAPDWEIISLELQQSANNAKDILGTLYHDDILSDIFSNFCIGK